MRTRTYLIIAAIISFGGTAFAGYLSAVKLATQTCAFNEPCPYVLGYPACWYGLALFSAMAVATSLGLMGKMAFERVLRANAAISCAGILFAGWLTWGEFSVAGRSYALGLPTCAYGLIFYILMFGATMYVLTTARSSNQGR